MNIFYLDCVEIGARNYSIYGKGVFFDGGKANSMKNMRIHKIYPMISM